MEGFDQHWEPQWPNIFSPHLSSEKPLSRLLPSTLGTELGLVLLLLLLSGGLEEFEHLVLGFEQLEDFEHLLEDFEHLVLDFEELE